MSILPKWTKLFQGAFILPGISQKAPRGHDLVAQGAEAGGPRNL